MQLQFITCSQEKEEWRSIPGFEGWYEVSNLGRVKRVRGGRGAVAGKILSKRVNRKGYISVYLHKFESEIQTKKSVTVHRLVAEAFIGPPPTPHHEINHRNADKQDNRPQNLEWVTMQENMDHSWEMGLRSYYGEGSHTAKLTEHDVYEIIELKGKVRQRDLAKRYGVDLNQIKAIHRGISWKHITCIPEISEQLTNSVIHTRKGVTSGQINGNAKLSQQQVVEIKRLFNTHSNKEIARMYHVSRDCIYHIRIGKTWTHINL